MLLPLSASSTTIGREVRLYNYSSATPIQTGTLDTSMLGTQFYVYGTNCTGASIPQNGYCSIYVRFRPTTTGLDTKNLTLQLLSPSSIPQDITLRGTGVTPTFSMSTNALDFGNVPLGQSADLSVTVSNGNAPGSAPVTFLPVSISALGTPFSIVSDGCATVLAVGASCTVAVRYTPTTAGSDTVNLFLYSDPPNGIQLITLQGKGGAGAASVPALGIYPLLALAALLCGLGCWQGARRKR